MDYTKLENTIKLYHYYAPKFVMWEGKPYRVTSLPLGGNDLKILYNSDWETIGIIHSMRTVIIHDCRLMLRNPMQLTEVELQELAGMLFSDKAKVSKVDGKHIILLGYINNVGNTSYLGRFDLHNKIPLHIAHWFFKKQINFLSLPPEIAVEVDNTNNTEI